MNFELETHQSAVNLKCLSNEELNSHLHSLVRQEREILSEILSHIAEVDRRRLYLDMAYPNLFTYLTEHLGYSKGSAQRRIDAARLLKEVPTLTNKLEAGNINLMQVSVVQKAIRQKKKETKTPISKEEKQQLLERLSGQSFEATQKIVAQILDLEIQQAPQIRHQKDSSVRFEVTFSEEQWQKLQHMRELLSNSVPSGSWDQVLEYVADKVIAQKTKPAKARSSQPSAAQDKVPPKTPKGASQTKHSPHSPNNRPVPAAIKRQVIQRDSCCQFVDPVSGKKCAAKWHLHIDHTQPRWAGGSNEIENLRVLCQQHNLHIYKQQAGWRTPI